MDDVHDKLDELTSLLEQARAMPMSSSAIVPRAEVLALVDELRELLPEALTRAEQVLEERDAVVEQARQEAARTVAEAERERERLIEESEIHRSAEEQARWLLEDAAEQAAQMRAQADDYVDGKLADFEDVLHTTLVAVENGRAKLAARSAPEEQDGVGQEQPADTGQVRGRVR